jgi:Protein of unknown function (DUF3592)
MTQSSNQKWKPPDRLGYSSLRAVRLSGHGRVIAILVGLMMIGGFVMGAYLARKSRREVQEQRLLADQGVTADAAVTRLWRTGDEANEPRVAYRFDYQGAVYTATVRAPLAKWRELRVGSRLAVRFVPSRPALSHPVDWPWRGMPFWIPYFATAMMAGGGALLAVLLARQMRLLAEGRPAPGRVTRIRKDKGGQVVRYEFQASGATFNGRAHVRKMPPEGEPLCVLYDPENPKRNALYPLPFVKLD